MVPLQDSHLLPTVLVQGCGSRQWRYSAWLNLVSFGSHYRCYDHPHFHLPYPKAFSCTPSRRSADVPHVEISTWADLVYLFVDYHDHWNHKSSWTFYWTIQDHICYKAHKNVWKPYGRETVFLQEVYCIRTYSYYKNRSSDLITHRHTPWHPHTQTHSLRNSFHSPLVNFVRRGQ